jgi:hypothetical protein
MRLNVDAARASQHHVVCGVPMLQQFVFGRRQEVHREQQCVLHPAVCMAWPGCVVRLLESRTADANRGARGGRGESRGERAGEGRQGGS